MTFALSSLGALLGCTFKTFPLFLNSTHALLGFYRMTFYHQSFEPSPHLTTLDVYRSKARTLISRLASKYEAGAYPFLNALDTQSEAIAKEFQEKIEAESLDLYVFGTGGSSLGGKTLAELKHAYAVHSFMRPRVHFLENIDPHSFSAFLSQVNLKKSAFLIISKSGATAETLFQFLTLLAHLPNAEMSERIAVVTEIKDSPLHKLAQNLNLPIIPHSQTIGGRFSIFSVVGMLPAAIAGIDCDKLRSGAKGQLKAIFEQESSPFIDGLAVLLEAHDDPRKCEVVMMPYVDRLVSFSFWFRQLWAESLGKQGKGMTPLQSLGTVDQHSLLQLYVDGPRNKVFTVVGQTSPASRLIPHAICETDARLDYLTGSSMGDLLYAEQRATVQSLRNQGHLVREFTFETFDEQTLGALLVHTMIEVIALAEFLEIDAFDQPAVEESKVLTKEYLKLLRSAS